MLLETEDKFIIAGDVHGNLYHMRRLIDYAVKKQILEILIVGDFGFYEVYRKFLKDANEYAGDNGVVVYFLDGNHEDHKTLNSIPLNSEGYRKIMDNIYHLPRGFMWEWMGAVKCMTLGGAYGVDRDNGVKNVDWFGEELINGDDRATAVRNFNNFGGVDILFTHDCPDKVRIPALERYKSKTLNEEHFPKVHLEGAQKHRELLGEIVDEIIPKHLYHGHYHCRYDEVRINKNGETTQVHGLDKDDRGFEKCVIVMDFLDFLED